MKCIRCQKELPDGAMYCKFCGQKQNLRACEKISVNTDLL
ncbi:MAG: zinc-ribbon domain-containing protein [[Clostridium] leptum]